MSWRFIGVKSSYGMWYVHEEYEKDCITVEAIMPSGETLEELLEDLTIMQKDIEEQLRKQNEKTTN